jgi:hypothetical protein
VNPEVFISEDSYFYLVIARRIAREGMQSFSGVFLTNGFHPLWGYLLAGYTWCVLKVAPSAILNAGYAAPLSGALLLGTIHHMVQLARRIGLDPIVVAVPVLVFFGCLDVLNSEAHLHIFALAWLLRAASVRPVATHWTGWLRLGVLVAITTLARLDAAFLSAFILLWCLWRDRPCVWSLVVAAAAPLVSVGLYLVTNQIVFGSILPVSGWLKSTFPIPIVPALSMSGGYSSLAFGGYSILFGWLPLVFSISVVFWRRASLASLAVLKPALAGAAAQACYTTVFTSGWTLWKWYYVAPIALSSIALGATLTGSFARRWMGRAALILALMAICFLEMRKPTLRDDDPSVRTARWIKDNVRPDETVLLSEFPGRAAFLSDAHVIAADMLTGNSFLYDEMVVSQNGLQFLLDSARLRGHFVRYIVCNGGIFLRASSITRLELHDPKVVSNARVLGALAVGMPSYQDPKLTVWTLR